MGTRKGNQLVPSLRILVEICSTVWMNMGVSWGQGDLCYDGLILSL